MTDIELEYKKTYLPYFENWSLILCYDWSEGGDFELILEDIENIDFEKYADHETILADWRLEKGIYRYYARLYSSNGHILLRNMDLMRYDCPELIITGADTKAWYDVWEKVEDSVYSAGYNPMKGDKNLLTKTDFYFTKDYVTPLLEKYYERKKRLAERKKQGLDVN